MTISDQICVALSKPAASDEHSREEEFWLNFRSSSKGCHIMRYRPSGILNLELTDRDDCPWNSDNPLIVPRPFRENDDVVNRWNSDIPVCISFAKQAFVYHCNSLLTKYLYANESRFCPPVFRPLPGTAMRRPSFLSI
jgi:hypothetical protein